MQRPKGKQRGEHLFWRSEKAVWYGWQNVRDAGEGAFKRVKRSMGTADIELARTRLQEWERDSADPSGTKQKRARLKDAWALLSQDRLALVKAGKRSGESREFWDTMEKAWLLYAGRLISRVSVKDSELTQEKKIELRAVGGELALLDVDRGFRDGFITYRRTQGVSENTIGKNLVTMKNALYHAKVAGLWSGDLDVMFPRGFEVGYTPSRVHLSHEDADKILALLPVNRRAHAAFILATGAERSAVLRVQREDLDRVPLPLHGTKTDDRERHVFIVLAWQTDLLKLAKLGFDGKDGKAFSPWANSTRDLQVACTAAGVSRVSLHGLRHVFGGWALDDGMSMNTVSKGLGHRDMRMLSLVYDNRDPSVLQKRAVEEAAGRSETRKLLHVLPGGRAQA